MSEMLVQPRDDEMESKMHAIKDLYYSRHYTQCAKLGEKLLAELHDEIHPVQLAYLNFYTALSHDTLAREATLKNRYKELSLAEKHYSTAIAVLSSSKTQRSEVELLSSPTSTASVEDRIWDRRSSNAGSFDSTASTASSATSYSFEEHPSDSDPTSKRLTRLRYTRPSRDFGSELTATPKLLERNNAVVSPLSASPQTHQEYQFAADISDFVRMMQGHLSSVRQLKGKTAIPGVRFTFPSPRPSSTTSKPRSSHLFDDEEAEAVRQRRRTVQFRRRFDPTSVQRLCGEVLAELS